MVSWKLCAAIGPNVPSDLAAIFAEEPVGVVLDDGDPCRPGDLEDRIHLAGHPRVVHRDDRTRPAGDQAFEPALVEVQGVATDVDEDRGGATEHERIDGR